MSWRALEGLRRATRVLPGRLTASIALWSFGQNASLVAFSWSVLRLSGSTVAVAVLFALRAAPRVVVGLPAGVVADRIGHRTSVAIGNLVAAGVIGAMAVLAGGGRLGVALTIGAAVPLSCCDALRQAGTQALANDLALEAHIENALASMNLTTQAFALAGSVIGGLLLGPAGLAVCLALVAVTQLGAAWFAARSAGAAEAARGPQPVSSLRKGFMLLRRSRRLRIIAGLIMLAEIAFFSTQAVLPTYARDALGGNAATLGILVGAEALGGVLVLGWLAAIRLPAAAVILFVASLVSGVAMLSQSVAPGIVLAVLALVVLGGALATIDTATQSLLQQSAPRGQRSAAAGVWVFSVGVAPLGQLCIGAVAATVGIRWALAGFAVAGLLLTAILGELGRRRGQLAERFRPLGGSSTAAEG